MHRLSIIALVLSIGYVFGYAGVTRQSLLQAANYQHIATAYSSLPGWDSADVTSPANLLKFAGENMAHTFDLYQDTMPESRPKLIHARGSMGSVEFKVTNKNLGYTGLFATGGDSCLARLSVAVNPNGGQAFTPGMALKCFRDNQPSANIISMYSLDGQTGNWNFFANEFSNIITEPTAIALKTLERLVFNRASECATWLSVSQFAEADQYGNAVNTPAHPTQVWFVPAEIQFSSAAHGDFRDDLATIPVGTKIWDVYGSTTKGGDRVKIGEIVSTGKFIASDFSDNTLFFQHQRGETDGCRNQ